VNDIIRSLFDRKSVRSFEDRPISGADRDLIVDAAIQAPTAGNQVMYTILDITDQALKDQLAITCDNQPFIAKAPLVLVFLADCRRWLDCYDFAGAERREPGVGDLLLACEDASIAAQNAVTAAHSLGIGSCYIGDILENRERHVELLRLDEYVVPVAMLVFGYPTAQQAGRPKPPRFGKEYIVRENAYSRLSEAEARAMFVDAHPEPGFDFDEFIRAFCARKYMSGFSLEMKRSVEEYLGAFMREPGS
jgi:nitroreductase